MINLGHLNEHSGRLGEGSPSMIGIYGVSNPYVWNLIELAAELDKPVLLVANKEVPQSLGLSEWIGVQEALQNYCEVQFICGVVQPKSKKVVLEEGSSAGLDFTARLVSPRAAISPTAGISDGAIIRKLAVLDSHVSLGAHVTVSPLVVVGHHAKLGDFCHISNGATINGNANLGKGVFVGAGAVIRDAVSIGDWATIGMGAVVTQNVPPGTTVWGNPARMQSVSSDKVEK